MLPWMICENVCNSFANDDDIKKLAAIILTQATLNFRNVYDSCGNNNSFFIKAMDFHHILKKFPEKP